MPRTADPTVRCGTAAASFGAGHVEIVDVVVQFRVLGPPEIVRDGRVVPLGGPKQQTLLALFLLRPNRFVTADWLVDRLTPISMPGRSVSSSPSVTISSRLRGAIARCWAERCGRPVCWLLLPSFPWMR